MDLLNTTGLKVAYTMGMRPDGRELLVVVAKGTFDIPENEAEATLADQQADLVMADEFTGEPGLSAPLYESEFAPTKPRCDVLLNGSAYAAGGKPARRVRVGLEIGTIRKSFDVVGDRVWKKRLWWVHASRPVPFRVKSISYDVAFGGADNSHPSEKRRRTYLPNHVGRGFHVNLKGKEISGKPLPNTEEVGRPIRTPKGKYAPMAFGPVTRMSEARVRFAGTYNQKWQDEIFPFLPPDFDDRYYQSAPTDQQLEFPKGGERVTLRNLTPAGTTAFRLPRTIVPVTFYLRNYDEHSASAVMDSIVIEPDLKRVLLVWRSSLLLRRNMFEVSQVLVGTMPASWHRARRLGKTWYPSLGALVDASRSEEEESEANR